MATITFMAYDGCMFSGVAALMDAFSICNLWHEYALQNENQENMPADIPLFDMEIVSPGGKPFMANGGIRMEAHRPLEAVEKTDLVLIPPFLFNARKPLTPSGNMLQWLTGLHQDHIRIGAICTGVFILAMTGLLDGKIATTNWQLVNRFRHQFPEVILKPERLLTQDTGLICSGAVTAQYNMLLYIIELFGSTALSRKCAKAFLVDPSRTTQAPYMITSFWKEHGDREISTAQRWMEDHYAGHITIDEVACQVNLSPRHFKRRFKKATGETPLAYLQQIRMESAKSRLETTRDNIEEITRLIGYEDSSTFRRLFKKHTDLSPREYRDKFSICR